MAEVIQYKDHTKQLERDRTIFRKRLAGFSARDIADELGLETVGEVFAAMNRMGTGITPEYKARVVELDLERLEELHKVYFEKAIAGDKEAASLVCRFMDRRAKYCGLDVLPGASTATDDSREPSSFDKVYEVIMRMARGPTIEGEVVVEEPPKES